MDRYQFTEALFAYYNKRNVNEFVAKKYINNLDFSKIGTDKVENLFNELTDRFPTLPTPVEIRGFIRAKSLKKELPERSRNEADESFCPYCQGYGVIHYLTESDNEVAYRCDNCSHGHYGYLPGYFATFGELQFPFNQEKDIYYIVAYHRERSRRWKGESRQDSVPDPQGSETLNNIHVPF